MNIINFEILNKDSLQCSSFLGNNLFIGEMLHNCVKDVSKDLGLKHLYDCEENDWHQVLLFIKLLRLMSLIVLVFLVIHSLVFYYMELNVSIFCVGACLFGTKYVCVYFLDSCIPSVDLFIILTRSLFQLPISCNIKLFFCFGSLLLFCFKFFPLFMFWKIFFVFLVGPFFIVKLILNIKMILNFSFYPITF